MSLDVVIGRGYGGNDGRTGALVFSVAWLVALLFALGLCAFRRSLLPALAVGAVLAGVVLIELVRIGDPITRTDVVAVFTLCMLGAFCAVAPIAYVTGPLGSS